MASEAPPFWWQPPDWRAWALWPAAKLYGAVAASRMRRAKRAKVAAPVLCIGNFTVGGTGKTPTAIAFAKIAKEQGRAPGILSRGHGGELRGPHVVDLARDTAKQVGDEPLLLAEHAPVAVSPDREAGARLLIERGCDFLIMDDGFQSARIRIDYALAVVDARYGIGNGEIIPAGPLRAPMNKQIVYATGLLCMGEGTAADPIVRMAARAGKPIFRAATHPADPTVISGKRLLAFAGIGHPDRFFDALSANGGEVVVRRAFADHHDFSLDELTELEETAQKEQLQLVTTKKDAARLRHRELPPLLRSKLAVFEVATVFEDEATAPRIIAETVKAWKERSLDR